MNYIDLMSLIADTVIGHFMPLKVQGGTPLDNGLVLCLVMIPLCFKRRKSLCYLQVSGERRWKGQGCDSERIQLWK